MGRATQGVKLIRLEESDNIADVTVVTTAEEEMLPSVTEETPTTETSEE
jgi:DNA gyrase/topoisomerase IV subunit A